MGLIKAALGAGGGVLADQWREFFYCEAIPADVLVVKCEKVGGKSPVSPLRVLAAVLLALAALGLIFWLCSGSDLELSVFRFDACSHGVALDASCSADIPVETVSLQSPVLHTAAMTCAPQPVFIAQKTSPSDSNRSARRAERLFFPFGRCAVNLYNAAS